MESTSYIFDCIIIGGGPAGLYASIYLARFCRNVLLIDDQQSRARLIPRTHNYPGYPEGIEGVKILELLKQQVACYPIQTVNAFVETIEKSAKGQFIVSTSNASYHGKSILLATGIADNCPSLCTDEKHILSGALHHCLVCDGFEVKNKRVIVFGCDKHAHEVAQGLLIYTNDIHVVISDKKINFTPEEKEFLKTQGVKIYEKPIASISFTNKQETCVKWKDGTTLMADASYLGMGMKLKMPQLINFNIKCNEQDRLQVNVDQKTSVKGVFAAGDVCNNLGQITTAFGSAATAAREIHQFVKDVDDSLLPRAPAVLY